MKNPIKNIVSNSGIPVFCSWSGGKDSSLALYRAIDAGALPRFLLTILHEEGKRSRSHGLSKDFLQAQASCLGIPLITRSATWSEYESAFIEALQELKQCGVKSGVFGDIDLEDHRLWEERVCRTAGIEASLPLWKSSRDRLLQEFFSLGFQAMIIASDAEKMGNGYLGKILDAELVEEFTRNGIDPSGEAGEYHTVVFDGPIFRKPVKLQKGKSVLRSGLWYLDVSVR